MDAQLTLLQNINALLQVAIERLDTIAESNMEPVGTMICTSNEDAQDGYMTFKVDMTNTDWVPKTFCGIYGNATITIDFNTPTLEDVASYVDGVITIKLKEEFWKCTNWFIRFVNIETSKLVSCYFDIHCDIDTVYIVYA